MASAEPRVFKILSIDGGGIKGLYTAALLQQLEQAAQERHKRDHPDTAVMPRLNQYFDLIAGTSTGAITACGLAAGKSAAEVLAQYRTLGPKVFPDTWWLPRFARSIRQVCLGARYSQKALKTSLEEFLPGKRFSDSENYLLVPVTNMVNYSSRIFKTRHSRLNFDDNNLLSDIALASAAAPTFFPLSAAPDAANGLYADGGLYANNPTLLCLIEALRVFIGDKSQRNLFDEIAILSLGNYGSPQGFRKSWLGLGSRVGCNKSTLGWMIPQRRNIPLLAAVLDAQATTTRFSIEILLECLPAFTQYCRLDGRTGKAPSTPEDRRNSFFLSDARAETLRDLESFGKLDGQTAATDPKVLSFFETTRQPIQCFY